MAAKKAQEPNIARLFTQLNNEGENGDYDKALEIADTILSTIPDDPDALYCKIVCYIQLSQFEDATKMIDGIRKDGETQFLFEKAYCLYRTEKYAESLHCLEKMAPGDHRFWDLKAQVLYRLERFSEAVKVYEMGMRQAADGLGNEREANYVASLALSDHASLVAQQESLHADTMEQCFNRACCYLAAGMPDDAMKMIDLAEERCKSADNEEEQEDELAVIHVQRGYALQLKGSMEQAMAMYNMVLKQKPNDVSLIVIGSNNIIALNKEKDVFDSKKRIKALLTEGGYKKLNSLQKSTVLLNRCLFALQTNQLDQCRQLVDEMKKKYPNSAQAILSEVALLNREKKVSTAVQILEEHVKACPNTSLLIYTTLAQLHLVQNNMAMVCQVLLQCPDRSSHMGVVSVLVTLLISLGKVETATQVFDEAVAWWSQLPQTKSTLRASRVLMLESAKFKLEHNNPEGAVLLLEKLLSSNQSDLTVLALLISAYSHFNPLKAEETSKLLPAYGGGPVDITTLEKMPGIKLQRKVVQKADVKLLDIERKKKAKKKKRKTRLPKHFDPSVPIDPERWLSLKERSYYRRGRKKGFTSIGRGTQGTSAATAAITAQLDASKPKINVVEGQNTVKGKGETGKPDESPQAVSAKKKVSQQQQQQKKKKKTKGW